MGEWGQCVNESMRKCVKTAMWLSFGTLRSFRSLKAFIVFIEFVGLFGFSGLSGLFGFDAILILRIRSDSILTTGNDPASSTGMV